MRKNSTFISTSLPIPPTHQACSKAWSSDKYTEFHPSVPMITTRRNTSTTSSTASSTGATNVTNCYPSSPKQSPVISTTESLQPHEHRPTPTIPPSPGDRCTSMFNTIHRTHHLTCTNKYGERYLAVQQQDSPLHA